MYNFERTDDNIKKLAKKKWDSIAKPIDSLGEFENLFIKIAAIKGNVDFTIKNKTMVVFCSDNGVVAEGVTQTDSSVTTIVANNIPKGVATISKLSGTCGAKAIAVDVGINGDTPKGVLNYKVSKGTNNIANGPAMTKEQMMQAINAGIDVVKNLKDKTDIIGLGEMGIGNTTTTSAVASVLLGIPVEKATGKGAGLTSAGLERKVNVIKVNEPNPNEPLDVLMKLGGYDICAMTGAFLGGGMYKIPIVIDGVIACLSAYIACLINPNTVDYILPSHMGREPVASILLEKMDLKPVIYGNMALGEGSGAVMLFPLLDMAMALYNNVTFEQIEMKPYERLI
jgi:nicotinate-nucleotide--dimethylbenzimidazole phosphoribosyltransferase